MIGNEQGGIISKLFIIPAGVAVIVGAFSLGYYMGKNNTAVTATLEKPPALPEVVSEFLPNKEDLTFYRTLTEKGERSLSIDVKPRPKQDAPPPPVREQDPAAAIGSGGGKKPPDGLPGRKPEQAEKQKQEGSRTVAAKKEEPPAKTAGASVRYTIQTASYSDRTMAEEDVRSLKRRGYAAFVAETSIAGKGTWYRVRIGSFSSRESAEKLANDLRTKENITPFVATE